MFWARQDSPNFSPQMRLAFQLPGGDKPHRVRIPLSPHPEYTGNISQIRIDPVINGGEGKSMRVYRIWLE